MSSLSSSHALNTIVQSAGRGLTLREIFAGDFLTYRETCVDIMAKLVKSKHVRFQNDRYYLLRKAEPLSDVQPSSVQERDWILDLLSDGAMKTSAVMRRTLGLSPQRMKDRLRELVKAGKIEGRVGAGYRLVAAEEDDIEPDNSVTDLETRQRIVRLLDARGAMVAGDIAESLGESRTKIYNRLRSMIRSGQLVRMAGTGEYSLPDQSPVKIATEETVGEEPVEKVVIRQASIPAGVVRFQGSPLKDPVAESLSRILDTAQAELDDYIWRVGEERVLKALMAARDGARQALNSYTGAQGND